MSGSEFVYDIILIVAGLAFAIHYIEQTESFKAKIAIGLTVIVFCAVVLSSKIKVNHQLEIQKVEKVK